MQYTFIEVKNWKVVLKMWLSPNHHILCVCDKQQRSFHFGEKSAVYHVERQPHICHFMNEMETSPGICGLFWQVIVC